MKYQVRVKTTRYEDFEVEAVSLPDACSVGESLARAAAEDAGVPVASAEAVSIKEETK